MLVGQWNINLVLLYLFIYLFSKWVWNSNTQTVIGGHNVEDSNTLYWISWFFLKGNLQVHLKQTLNMVKKFIFSCNLFKKVKRSYILDSLHVK